MLTALANIQCLQMKGSSARDSFSPPEETFEFGFITGSLLVFTLTTKNLFLPFLLLHPQDVLVIPCVCTIE